MKCNLFGLLLGIATVFSAEASEPFMSPPADYLSSAPAGDYPCYRGMKSQISNLEFRRFAARNQIWAQESKEAFGDPADWTNGGYLVGNQKRWDDFWRANRTLKAHLYVLVGAEGLIVDKVVVCSNKPERNEALLGVLDAMEFNPSTYKGRALVTIFPLKFDY